MKFISRINRVFSDEFLDEMYDLFKQHKFYMTKPDGTKVRVDDVRHMKALKFREKLSDYLTGINMPHTFLGDGTNRMAILIDGFVFKLALDDQGYIDNLTEFKMSKEAQPYVTKTYETNGLFCVAEYVTLISYDEFVKQKSKILEILDILSTEYLLGDMGWTKKNYCNWGYRKNSKDLVILDYGHMLKIETDKMLCQDCGGFLHYNSTFTEIQCISCNKKSDFMSMKSRISKREEMEMIDKYLNNSISTSEGEVEIEMEESKQEAVYRDDEDEIVSNRFEAFKPEKKRRFSDYMEDDYEKYEEDDMYDFDAALRLLEDYNQDVEYETPKNDYVPQRKELSKIQDYKLKGWLMMDREDAEYDLSQKLALNEINFRDYSYYMSKLEEYHENQMLEDDEDDEELSTIGEVFEAKQQVKQQVEEDPYEDVDYYEQMLNIMDEGKNELVQAPVEEDEEVEYFDADTENKMNQMMQNLLDLDDYDENAMTPEQFLARNMADLGFDEEDSEEDIEAFDAVLNNIRKGNVDLDELEEMIEEEEVVNTEDDYMATLEVFEPKVEIQNEEVKPERENVIRLDDRVKSDNVFKVVRNTNNVEMQISGSIDEPKLADTTAPYEPCIKVKEVNDEAESMMDKVFRQMQETGMLETREDEDDDF